jgi:hypothetical protein
LSKKLFEKTKDFWNLKCLKSCENVWNIWLNNFFSIFRNAFEWKSKPENYGSFFKKENCRIVKSSLNKEKTCFWIVYLKKLNVLMFKILKNKKNLLKISLSSLDFESKTCLFVVSSWDLRKIGKIEWEMIMSIRRLDKKSGKIVKKMLHPHPTKNFTTFSLKSDYFPNEKWKYSCFSSFFHFLCIFCSSFLTICLPLLVFWIKNSLNFFI